MGTFDILKAAFYTPTRRGWGVPVKLEGAPGIGKTAMIEQLGEQLGVHVETLVLSLMESVEAQGHPFLTENKVEVGGRIQTVREMDYAPPAWARRAATAGRSIVLLDELNTCPPPVFSAFMRVVNERACGSFSLGEGTRFVSAINPTDIASAAGGVDLPMAFANRWCHLTADIPAFEQWAEWLVLREGVNDAAAPTTTPEEREDAVMAAWPEAFAAASADVIGFLSARPTRRLVLPEPASKDAAGAWASPRSWDMFTRARASSKVHKLDHDDADAFQVGCVGKSVYAEFRAWLRDADLPDAKMWLRGQVDFEHRAERLDRTAAFLLAAVIQLQSMEPGKRDEELARFVAFMGTFERRRDILVNAVSMLGGVIRVDEIARLDKDLRKVLTTIGVLAKSARS